MLFDQEASAALPYWHEGEKASAAFEALRECLVVMQHEAGYLSYDPQLDRFFAAASANDLRSAVGRYLEVKHSAERAIFATPPRKPRWKFWWPEFTCHSVRPFTTIDHRQNKGLNVKSPHPALDKLL